MVAFILFCSSPFSCVSWNDSCNGVLQQALRKPARKSLCACPSLLQTSPSQHVAARIIGSYYTPPHFIPKECSQGSLSQSISWPATLFQKNTTSPMLGSDHWCLAEDFLLSPLLNVEKVSQPSSLFLGR